MGGKSSRERREQKRRNKQPPPACPYCSAPAEWLANSAEVYHGHDYGPLWICRPCGAWVGVHKGSRTPLGRLANAELRAAKIAAHAVFDRLWRNGEITRGEAYQWLTSALHMETPAHIGEMDVAQCHAVVDACRGVRALDVIDTLSPFEDDDPIDQTDVLAD